MRFPFPNVDLGITNSGLSASKYTWLNIGEVHYSENKSVRSSSPWAYWSLSETVTSLMILFISQESDVEIVVGHWACDFLSFSEKCRKSKYRLFYS